MTEETPAPVLVCSACRREWLPVRRGCSVCGSDAGPVRVVDLEEDLQPAPLAAAPAESATSRLPGPAAGPTPPATPGTPAPDRGQHQGEPDNPGADTADTAPAKPPGPGRKDLKVPGAPEVRRHDWPTIKRRYVEGVLDKDQGMTTWPSLDDVAAHFDIYPTRVREKSAIEGWVEQRARWQAHLEKVRRDAKAAAMVKSATDLDGRALTTAQLGLQLCAARLTELAQAAQARRAATVGEGATSGIDALEMGRLASAVDLWHKIGLRAVGDPETHRLEITGAGGAPIEIATELKRDDPRRIADVLSVLRQAGMGDLFGSDPGGTVALERGADGSYAAPEPRD